MEKSILGLLNKREQTKIIFYIGDEVAQIAKETDTSKGVLQSITFEESRKPNPKWKDLVNFDILSKHESNNFVFGDTVCNLTNIKQCLFGLSINGTNEKEYREYDLKRKVFLEKGFKIPKGNTGIAWINNNTLLFASSFKGEKTSKSGYGLNLKLWKRGELINQAESILQVDSGDGINPRQFISEGKSYILVQHWLDFYNGDIYYYKNSQLKKLNVPTSHELYGVHKGFAILKLYKQWEINGEIFPLSSLVGVNLDSPDLNQPKLELIIAQNAHLSFDSVKLTKSYILLNILEDMKTKPLALQRLGETELGTRWEKKYINKPSNDVLRIRATSPILEEAIVGYRGFLNPNSLYFLDAVKGKHRFWASSPKAFNADNLAFSYHFAKGKDGVKIPYQMVGPKNLIPGKSYPVIIYVYGAYGEPVTAWHSSTLGKEWLSAGGIFVIANVRGGGAYGEKWHQSAVRTSKHKTTDDVSTVAKDLIQRNITTNKKIGVIGESLSGLTACSVAIAYPKLINAAFCRSALTDLIRYTKFFDGSAWISELGDPEDHIYFSILLTMC